MRRTLAHPNEFMKDFVSPTSASIGPHHKSEVRNRPTPPLLYNFPTRHDKWTHRLNIPIDCRSSSMSLSPSAIIKPATFSLENEETIFQHLLAHLGNKKIEDDLLRNRVDILYSFFFHRRFLAGCNQHILNSTKTETDLMYKKKEDDGGKLLATNCYNLASSVFHKIVDPHAIRQAHVASLILQNQNFFSSDDSLLFVSSFEEVKTLFLDCIEDAKQRFSKKNHKHKPYGVDESIFDQIIAAIEYHLSSHSEQQQLETEAAPSSSGTLNLSDVEEIAAFLESLVKVGQLPKSFSLQQHSVTFTKEESELFAAWSNSAQSREYNIEAITTSIQSLMKILYYFDYHRQVEKRINYANKEWKQTLAKFDSSIRHVSDDASNGSWKKRLFEEQCPYCMTTIGPHTTATPCPAFPQLTPSKRKDSTEAQRQHWVDQDSSLNSINMEKHAETYEILHFPNYLRDGDGFIKNEIRLLLGFSNNDVEANLAKNLFRLDLQQNNKSNTFFNYSFIFATPSARNALFPSVHGTIDLNKVIVKREDLTIIARLVIVNAQIHQMMMLHCREHEKVDSKIYSNTPINASSYQSNEFRQIAVNTFNHLLSQLDSNLPLKNLVSSLLLEPDMSLNCIVSVRSMLGKSGVQDFEQWFKEQAMRAVEQCAHEDYDECNRSLFPAKSFRLGSLDMFEITMMAFKQLMMMNDCRPEGLDNVFSIVERALEVIIGKDAMRSSNYGKEFIFAAVHDSIYAQNIIDEREEMIANRQETLAKKEKAKANLESVINSSTVTLNSSSHLNSNSTINSDNTTNSGASNPASTSSVASDMMMMPGRNVGSVVPFTDDDTQLTAPASIHDEDDHNDTKQIHVYSQNVCSKCRERNDLYFRLAVLNYAFIGIGDVFSFLSQFSDFDRRTLTVDAIRNFIIRSSIIINKSGCRVMKTTMSDTPRINRQDMMNDVVSLKKKYAENTSSSQNLSSPKMNLFAYSDTGTVIGFVPLYREKGRKDNRLKDDQDLREYFVSKISMNDPRKIQGAQNTSGQNTSNLRQKGGDASREDEQSNEVNLEMNQTTYDRCGVRSPKKKNRIIVSQKAVQVLGLPVYAATNFDVNSRRLFRKGKASFCELCHLCANVHCANPNHCNLGNGSTNASQNSCNNNVCTHYNDKYPAESHACLDESVFVSGTGIGIPQQWKLLEKEWEVAELAQTIFPWLACERIQKGGDSSFSMIIAEEMHDAARSKFSSAALKNVAAEKKTGGVLLDKNKNMAKKYWDEMTLWSEHFGPSHLDFWLRKDNGKRREYFIYCSVVANNIINSQEKYRTKHKIDIVEHREEFQHNLKVLLRDLHLKNNVFTLPHEKKDLFEPTSERAANIRKQEEENCKYVLELINQQTTVGHNNNNKHAPTGISNNNNDKNTWNANSNDITKDDLYSCIFVAAGTKTNPLTPPIRWSARNWNKNSSFRVESNTQSWSLKDSPSATVDTEHRPAVTRENSSVNYYNILFGCALGGLLIKEIFGDCLVGSHRCGCGTCANVFHVVFEMSVADQSRNYCHPSSCNTHSPPCFAMSGKNCCFNFGISFSVQDLLKCKNRTELENLLISREFIGCCTRRRVFHCHICNDGKPFPGHALEAAARQGQVSYEVATVEVHQWNEHVLPRLQLREGGVVENISDEIKSRLQAASRDCRKDEAIAFSQSLEIQLNDEKDVIQKRIDDLTKKILG